MRQGADLCPLRTTYHASRTPRNLEADWRRARQPLAGGGERAARGVHAEEVDVVGRLVTGDQPFAGGVEGEVAGVLAARRLVPRGRKRARFRVDPEDCNAVVAAVGAVEKLPR